jgi:hypothetical protein
MNTLFIMITVVLSTGTREYPIPSILVLYRYYSTTSTGIWDIHEYQCHDDEQCDEHEML